ncbi:unnamed protein product [Brugia pahangi]|uniref:Uncharacterized protein n=1 Tax=Brugia pahangi TaxID=6280 RepID=A0A3P7RDE3_BRUPA|nr:unnamed protein product [Brugia pahangi]
MFILSRTDLAVSLGNCFASGIFLSSCFLSLLPHIRKHEEHIRNMWISTVGHTDSSSYIFLNSELVVLMSFLLVLSLEEVGSIFEVLFLYFLMPLTKVFWRHAEIEAMRDSASFAGNCNPAPFKSIFLFSKFNNFVRKIPQCFIFSQEKLLIDPFYSLLTAVMIHEVLCSFGLGVSLAQQKTTAERTFISSLILASGIPMGMSSSILVILFSDKFHRNVHTILLIRFVLEGFAAGAFIYVACVEILNSEMSVHNHGTRQGLFKALAVIISLFTFFFVNIIFGQRLHYSLRYFNIL